MASNATATLIDNLHQYFRKKGSKEEFDNLLERIKKSDQTKTIIKELKPFDFFDNKELKQLLLSLDIPEQRKEVTAKEVDTAREEQYAKVIAEAKINTKFLSLKSIQTGTKKQKEYAAVIRQKFISKSRDLLEVLEQNQDTKELLTHRFWIHNKDSRVGHVLFKAKQAAGYSLSADDYYADYCY